MKTTFTKNMLVLFCSIATSNAAMAWSVYKPETQFNPPATSSIWAADYTNDATCSLPALPMTNTLSSAVFTPLLGFSYAPGQGNATLPVVLKNPLNTVASPNLMFAPKQILLHASHERCAVLSFTAPQSGMYHIVGKFHKTGNTTGVAPHPKLAGVFIKTNTNTLFSGMVSVTTSVNQQPFTLPMIPLNAGDKVHFMANDGGVLDSNTVALKVRIVGP